MPGAWDGGWGARPRLPPFTRIFIVQIHSISKGEGCPSQKNHDTIEQRDTDTRKSVVSPTVGFPQLA